MERILNSSVEKQTIYEIFRACRLCGGGAGYKMPIIQNVVDLDGSEVELKQKIRECVHIEVDQEDKMPPLICELCVDKVNDFYEFLEMCRQINMKTRLRLGLPPQTMSQGASDAGDCILGVTEQVYVNEDSNEPLAKRKSKSKHNKNEDTNEPLAKKKSKLTRTENEDSNETLAKKKLKSKHNDNVKKEEKISSKKEPELLVKLEKHPGIKSSYTKSQAARIMRSGKRIKSPSPKQIADRSSRSSNRDDNIYLAHLKTQKKVPKLIITKGILKKEIKTEPTLLVPRLKRLREKTPPKLNVPSKKVKLAVKTEQIKSNSKHSPRRSKSPPRLALRSSPKVSPKTSREVPKQALKPETEQKLASRSTSRLPPKPEPKVALKPEPKAASKPSPKPAPKLTPKRTASPPPSAKCNICKQQFKNTQSLSNHLRMHNATYTSEKLACNACQEWFTSHEDAAIHHKRHAKGQYYHCRRCFSDFQQYQLYLDHIKQTCIPLYEVPDVQCPECWKYFPTENLLESHNCPGEDGRPGGKCEKCSRSYATLKNLRKHESVCTSKKKHFELDPELKSKLREFLVRTARCDPLLKNAKNNRYNVSNVDKKFGLDKNCVYPFSTQRQPRFAGMVKISDDLDFDEHYVHWDSDYSSDSTDTEVSDSVLSPFLKKKNIEKLSTLSLKTIFSHKFLGKVPRKRRKLKVTNCSTNQEKIDKLIENLDDTLGKDDESFSTCVNEKSMDESEKSTRSINDDVISREANSIPEKGSESASEKGKSLDESNKTGDKSIFDDQIDGKLGNQENVNKMQIDQVIDDKDTQDGNLLDINQVTSENVANLETSEEVLETSTGKENREPIISQIQISTSGDKSDSNVLNNDLKFETKPKNGEVKLNEDAEQNPNNKMGNPSTLSYKNGEITQDIAKTNNTTNNLIEIDSQIVNRTSIGTNNENGPSIESSSSNAEKHSTLDDEEHAASKSEISNNYGFVIDSLSELNKEKDQLKSSDVTKSVNVNGDQNEEKDDMDDQCELEMDDKQLMEELDAQIGENDNNRNVESEKCHTDVPKKDQSNELDSMSDDEFRFD